MASPYSHLPLHALSSEEFHELVSKAVSLFREGSDRAKRRQVHVNDGLASLFQTMAVMERCVVLNTRAQRDVPDKSLQDHYVHTPAFEAHLNATTLEFMAACRGCMPVMDSVHSITTSVSSIGLSFLNPLLRVTESDTALVVTSRAEVAENSLVLALQFSKVPWTPDMADALLSWYAPSFLLCRDTNAPTQYLPPPVQLALQWAMDLDENPLRRFKTMRDSFGAMLSSGHDIGPSIPVPSDDTPPLG